MEKGPVFFLTHMYTLIVLVATHYVLYACQKAFCLSRGKYMKRLPADSSDFSSLSRFEQWLHDNIDFGGFWFLDIVD